MFEATVAFRLFNYRKTVNYLAAKAVSRAIKVHTEAAASGAAAG
jgi:hypothetical protein